MKRRFLSIIALMLAFLTITGCQHPPDEEQTSAEESTASETTEYDYLDVVKNGAAIGIVYSLDADSELLSKVETLSNSIYKLSGVKPRGGDDWLKAGDSHDDNKVEILVGKTNYEESQLAYSEMHYGSGVCRVIGNKIVIAGTSSEALDEAIVSLVMALKANKDGDTVRIPKTFFEICKTNPQIEAVPVVEGCEAPVTVDCGDSCYELVFADATEAIYDGYLDKLEQSGFRMYAENNIDSNRFATFVNETYVLNLSLLKGRTLQITSEPLTKTALPILQADNVYQSVGCDTTLSQIGLYYGDTPDEKGYATKYINGMAYVYRLADGSFIVIDGGHATDGHAERLYSFLKAQAPDPNNVVVAAWIFSHDHDDHVGFFSTFATKYHEEIEVERFLFNFPGSVQYTASSGTGMSSYVKGGIKKYYPEAIVHRVHAGQMYYVRNATIRILFGLENLQPHSFTYYNNSSIIFQIEAEGVTTMFLGDCGEDECRSLTSTYSADTLKNDVLQVAHHGINGCDSSLYDLIGASYAFVPVGADKIKVDSSKIDSILGKGINKYVKELSRIPNRVFLAKDDVVVFTLADGAVSKITAYEDMAAFLQ